MRIIAMLVLAAATALWSMSGCAKPPIGYYPLGKTVEIDPANGDTLVTQFWKYDNGETTATFKRIPQGNTDRRREAPPPLARFSD